MQNIVADRAWKGPNARGVGREFLRDAPGRARCCGWYGIRSASALIQNRRAWANSVLRAFFATFQAPRIVQGKSGGRQMKVDGGEMEDVATSFDCGFRIAERKPPPPGPLPTLPQTPHPASGHLLPIRCGEGNRGGEGVPIGRGGEMLSRMLYGIGCLRR